MNWGDWLLWGFVSTLLLTTLLSGSQGLGWTRINLPFMLGTLVSPNRDRAELLGFGIHLVNGWFFALLYAAAFESAGRAGWERGAAIGFLHALFVLTIGMRLLPSVHPRMASERHGPAAAKLLEPPGFFALHYGVQTPLWTLAAHVVYGGVFGTFYRV
ncbi:MAG: hypothetical protein HY925_14680 [Elusimicrobia bacterium]|nr:hypothetical protein [Elusimicrobiota bacterium]